MRLSFITVTLAGLLATATGSAEPPSGVTIDKDKRAVVINAKIAPRKLDYLDQIYPIEVIACWPHPKGKKAHETVVTIEARPSDVHKALVDLGVKPGAPVMGESKEPPKGPDLKVFLEIPGPDGSPRQVSIDKTLLDKRTGKPFPKSVKFRFTGSAMTQADPSKPEKPGWLNWSVIGVPSSFFSASCPLDVALVQFDGFAAQIAGLTYLPPKIAW